MNADNGVPLSSLFGRLQVGRSYNPRCRNILSILLATTRYKLDPLPHYCIDHLYIGEMLLLKVPLQEHPWGVNVVLCNGENYNAHFKNWTFYLCKIEQSLISYVYIGGWWIESNPDCLETSFFQVGLLCGKLVQSFDLCDVVKCNMVCSNICILF